MTSVGIFYRKNHTDECFYKIIPDFDYVEVVYLFDDTYKAIERIRSNPFFIKELIQGLRETDEETYESAKKFAEACIRPQTAGSSDADAPERAQGE